MNVDKFFDNESFMSKSIGANARLTVQIYNTENAFVKRFGQKFSQQNPRKLRNLFRHRGLQEQRILYFF